MSELIVNSENELQEVNEPPLLPTPVRIIAKIISWLFHPVLVPVYMAVFLIFIHPYIFAGVSDWDKTKIFLQAFIMFAFFPIVTVLLLKAVGFIESIYLYTQKDRIIPLAACGIWYFWIWWVWYNQQYPSPAVQFALSVFIAATLAWLANIFFKISLHAISMGTVIAFIFSLALKETVGFGIYLSITLLVGGLVCTSRLIVSNHTQKEIYGGLFLGFISPIIAGWFF